MYQKEEMNEREEMNQSFNNVRKKLWMNLAVNWLVPLVLVILLRRIYHNDTIALAIAGAIPIVRTAAILTWRHRVDWIGVIGAMGFITAFIVSMLWGGSSLPLKLYHPLATGIIGLILLISAILRRPLLIIILQKLKHVDSERFNNQENYKKFAILTAFLGLVLVIDSVIHIIIAITLPAVTYMAVSKAITLAVIFLIIIGRKWIVQL